MKLNEFLLRDEKNFTTISSRTPKLLAKYLRDYGRRHTPPKKMSDVVRWLAYIFFFSEFLQKELDKLEKEGYPLEKTISERKKWLGQKTAIASEGLRIFAELHLAYDSSRDLVDKYLDTMNGLEKSGEARNLSAAQAIENCVSGKITHEELIKELESMVGEKWKDLLASLLQDRKSVQGVDLRAKMKEVEALSRPNHQEKSENTD